MKEQTINVTVPHQLGKAEARRRLEAGFGKAAGLADGVGAVDQQWQGDELSFSVTAMGQTVRGTATVHDQLVAIAVRLPWLLAKMAEVLRPQIEKKTREALALPAK